MSSLINGLTMRYSERRWDIAVVIHVLRGHRH